MVESHRYTTSWYRTKSQFGSPHDTMPDLGKKKKKMHDYMWTLIKGRQVFCKISSKTVILRHTDLLALNIW